MQVVARRLIFPWSGFQRPSGRMVDCDMMRHPDPSLLVRELGFQEVWLTSMWSIVWPTKRAPRSDEVAIPTTAF